MTGPSALMLSLSTMPMPWKPVSREPTESVKIVFGNAAIQRSLTGRLKIAALLETAKSEEPSYVAALVRLDQRAGHRVAGHEDQLDLLALDDRPDAAGSNLGARIVGWPAKRCMSRSPPARRRA